MLSSQRLWPRSWSRCVAFMSPHFVGKGLIWNLMGEAGVWLHIAVFRTLSVGARLKLLDRFEMLVRARSGSKVDGESIASVARHVQLPSTRDGTFIRASAPKFSKS